MLHAGVPFAVADRHVGNSVAIEVHGLLGPPRGVRGHGERAAGGRDHGVGEERFGDLAGDRRGEGLGVVVADGGPLLADRGDAAGGAKERADAARLFREIGASAHAARVGSGQPVAAAP